MRGSISRSVRWRVGGRVSRAMRRGSVCLVPLEVVAAAVDVARAQANTPAAWAAYSVVEARTQVPTQHDDHPRSRGGYGVIQVIRHRHGRIIVRADLGCEIMC